MNFETQKAETQARIVEQWPAMLVEFEAMARSIDEDERRERRDRLEEQWAQWFVDVACVDPDAPPAFRAFVEERAEVLASGIGSPAELAGWLDRFDERIRTDYEEHLAEKRREHDDREEAFRNADPRRAFAAAMRADDTPAVRIVRAWKTQMLLLLGPPGIGKSVAACHFFYARGDRWPPTYITASEYVRLSRFDGTRDFALDAKNLLLDDLGAEYFDAKGSAATDFDELIDRFYCDPSRRLIATSNLSPEEFAARYGRRVIDRFREAGEIVALEGPSLRGGR